MDIQGFANSLNLPGVSAFMLGVMASLGPCTLATNLAAMAYISRRISDRRFAVTSGALYTLGRMITYSVLGMDVLYLFKKWTYTDMNLILENDEHV